MSDDHRNDRAYRAVCGRSPATEPAPAPVPPSDLSFHEALAFLYGRVKSQNRLAAALGEPRRTLRRWLAGETPGRTAADRERVRIVTESANRIVDIERQKLRNANEAEKRAARRARLTPGRERRLRGTTVVTVKARMRYRDEGGARTIKFTVGGDSGNPVALTPDAVAEAVDAFLSGKTADDGPDVQNAGIFGPLVDAMHNEKYREMFSDTDPEGLAFDVEGVTFS